MKRVNGKSIARTSVVAAALMLPIGTAAWGQGIEFMPLQGVRPPLPDLSGIVVNRNAAVLLGKALFWDMAAGSDGQACASCHFHAGADMRTKNQLNPGIRGGDVKFGDANGLTKSGAVSGPNYKLQSADFPFHLLADVNDRDSDVLYDTTDVVSSSGTYGSQFLRIQKHPYQGWIKTIQDDRCKSGPDPIFHTAYGNTRHVEPRNTPTTINAVFNYRSFWDGRANNVFNGVSPFGPRDVGARIVALGSSGLELQKLELVNASLASQAVGPPLSDQEMSCAGRTFADLGQKMLRLKPLAGQAVAPDDGVFGASGLRDPRGRGLLGSYLDLVRWAFSPKYWSALGSYRLDATGPVTDPLGYSQAELNFSMFWGVSIMLYEATLISDQSPYDDFLTRRDDSRFGQLERDGMQVFQGKGQCIACHRGPTLTSAALAVAPPEYNDFPNDTGNSLDIVSDSKEVERMPVGDERGQAVALYDNGFYNIGVRPASEDVGIGGTDPFDNPLSFARQFKANPANPGPDHMAVDPCDFAVPSPTLTCGSDLNGVDLSNERVAVDGAFKVPSLRNIAQTPPYFHNGGQATLQQVVEFYNRGGDRRNLDSPRDPMVTHNDTSGTGPLGEDIPVGGPAGSNLHTDVQPLGLTDYEKDALVAFLRSLTDDRVRCHAAPFDHPELTVSVGALDRDANGDGRADETFRTLAATGAAGIPNCSIPNDGNLFSINAALASQALR